MRVLRLLPLLSLVACSGAQGPSLSIKIAHVATGDGRCGSPGAVDPSLTSIKEISKLRITVRTHGKADEKGTFLCDRVLKVGEQPELSLRVSGQKKIDLFAEGFSEVMDANSATAGDFRRVAYGSLLDVDLSSKTFAPIRLVPAESFRCVANAMARARAFHSATLLPNKKVLIVGGAVASTDGSSENLTNNLLYVTGSAELYDPADGSFKEIMEDPAPMARAFHQAFSRGVDSQGRYQVLLVGGVASSDETKPALGVTNSGVGGPRLVPFDTSQTIPTALNAVGAKAELLAYDPVAGTIARSDVDGFDPAAFLAGAQINTMTGDPDGYVIAGGVDFVDPLESTMPTTAIRASRGTETTPREGNLVAPRLGASLTVLSDNKALLWGGGLTGGAAQAEILTGLAAGGTVMASALGIPNTPETQFHTATLIANTTDAQILVSGGFQVDTAGNASQPPAAADAVRTVTLAADGSISTAVVPFGGTYVSDSSTCSNPDRYRPAGWESAVQLPRGRGVLISGGSPTYVNGKCMDCDAGASLLCSIKQASVFSGGSISPALDRLQVGRFGHQTTLLADGVFLVSGGITLPPGGGVRVSADAEIYNPRTALPPFDMTAAMPVDADDPIKDDLVSDLHRAPAGNAYRTDPKSAASRCGDLN
jgi:hypothetical protein